jgi:hypothetical protein
VGDFVHTFGDAHLYSNHLEQAREQLARAPLPPPRLELDPSSPTCSISASSTSTSATTRRTRRSRRRWRSDLPGKQHMTSFKTCSRAVAACRR